MKIHHQSDEESCGKAARSQGGREAEEHIFDEKHINTGAMAGTKLNKKTQDPAAETVQYKQRSKRSFGKYSSTAANNELNNTARRQQILKTTKTAQHDIARIKGPTRSLKPRDQICPIQETPQDLAQER